jgi:glutaredoxin
VASRTGARTLPQVFSGDVHIGGFEELRALDARQGLIAVI